MRTVQKQKPQPIDSLPAKDSPASTVSPTPYPTQEELMTAVAKAMKEPCCTSGPDT